MRIWVGLAALAAGFSPQPVAAMTPGQADCPVQVAPRDLGALLAREMTAYQEGQAKNPAIVAGIQQILSLCLKREKVTDAQQDAYAKYAISRLGHDELARQLSAIRVPAVLLDRAFGLGPGLANPAPDQITEDQFNTVVVELGKLGLKVETLPKDASAMMGAYVAVTGEMYRNMALVR